MPKKKKIEVTKDEPIVIESKAIEIIKKEEEPPKALLIPENTINIPIGEYKQLQKPYNPMPWIAVFMVIFAGAIVLASNLPAILNKPTPVISTVIPTNTVLPTNTLVPSLTIVPTSTKDVMLNMQVINNYYRLLSSGDLETAWNCLTLKFRRDSFGNNFEEFKAHWSRTGPVAVYEIVPEKESDGQAIALVRLYFYYEQRIRYYRFHLQYNPLNNVWQIDSVETARPW